MRFKRTRASSSSQGSFTGGLPMDAMERLEDRTLLSTGPDIQVNRFEPAPLAWRGVQFDNWSTNSWIITFKGEQSREQARTRAAQVATAMGLSPSAIVPSPLGRFARIQTSTRPTEAAVDQAKQNFAFLHNVQPDLLHDKSRTPNDARYVEQWALDNRGQDIPGSGPGTPGADMSAEDAWNITTGSSRVIIAVVDTGIDLTHPDLRANLWRNPGEIPNNNVDDDGNGFIDDVNGWDFVGDGQGNGDNNPTDPATQGHGTAVAGTIGAVGNNALGVAGIAWEVQMIALKIFPDTGLAPNSAVINSQEYLVLLKRAGNNIIASNNSYGSVQDEQTTQFNDAEQLAIKSATDAGILFIAAAGNDSIDNDGSQRAYPASYDNPFIISVAATDNQDRLATFSNFGRTQVDIGAPGVRVLTTATGGGYEFIDGTSFASPYTAGVVALMASVNRFASKEQLRAALLASVDIVPGLQGQVVTNGRVNAFKAVRASRVEGLFVTGVSPGTQSANVSQIEVVFSSVVDPAFFTGVNSVELRRANGASSFGSGDTLVSLAGASIVLVGNRLTINLGAGNELSRDLYRLTLKAPNFRTLDGLRLNGDAATGNDEIYDFNVVSFRGPFEPNDTLSTATPLLLTSVNSVTLDDLFIGDGSNPAADVDMFRFYVSSPSLITIDLRARRLPAASNLDSFIRLFDSTGTQLTFNDNFEGLDSRVQFFVSGAGDYYLGVSAFPNTNYQVGTTNGRTANSTSGVFGFDLQIVPTAPETTNQPGGGTPIPLPDQGDIVSTINVTDGRTVQDLVVRVNLTHSYISDVRVTLTAPDGTALVLFNRHGGSGQNLTGTIFSDEAGTLISAGSAPFTGSFRPVQQLTPFKNRSGVGVWTLRVQDLKPLDSGVLNSWSIDFTRVNDIAGPFEVNDSVLLATDTGIAGTGSRTFDAAIGDGAFGLRDVDLFRFTAGTGTTITLNTQLIGVSAMRPITRLFDSQGRVVRDDIRKNVTTNLITFVVANAGVYYVGISGGSSSSNPGDLGNVTYSPLEAGSGLPSNATGTYRLNVTVSGGISEGQVTLTGNRVRLGIGSNGTLGNPGDSLGLSLDNRDFLLGNGAISSYFGAIFDSGFIVRNTADGAQTDVPMSVNNESDFNNRRVVATGLYRSLGVRRAISFGVNDQMIAIDITLTNRSQQVINNLAWLEGVQARVGFNIGSTDPLQDLGQTINNVQNTTGRLATSRFGNVTMGMAVPAGSFNVVTGFTAPGAARDPIALLNNPFDPDTSIGDTGASGSQDMAVGVNVGSLSPDQSVTFRYFLLMGNTQGEVNSLFSQLESGAGNASTSGHLVSNPRATSIASENLPYAIYYPEGFANNRASTFLPIVNAQAEGVRVVIIARYERSGQFSLPVSQVLYDSATDTPGGLIAASGRAGITLTSPDLFNSGTAPSGSSPGRVQSQIAGRLGVFKNTPYSLEIRSSAPIGATMSHYDFGITTGQSAISQLSNTWTFAEAQKGAGINDFVVFTNPGSEPVKVDLRFFTASGQLQSVFSQTVEAGRRSGWSVNSLPVPNGKYSLRLDADRPIVAALTHFNTNASSGYGATGLGSAGATTGGTAQGQIGLNGTTEVVNVFNPSNAPASVVLTFAFENASSYRRTINVPALGRGEVDVARLTGFARGQAYSVTYVSNVPVTLSLPSTTTTGASGATLTSSANTQWLFGEGFKPASGNAVQEYLRVYNPSLLDQTVEITLNFNDGTTESFRKTVPGRATGNFDLLQLVAQARQVPTIAGVGSFFGTRVISSVPVLAFMGHFDSFLGGGFGMLGTPLGTTSSPA